MATIHPVPAEWAARAYVDAAGYAETYRRSIEEPEAFWREESARLDWIRPWTQLVPRAVSMRPISASRGSPTALSMSQRQLSRPASCRAWRNGRDHLGRRRSGAAAQTHVSRAPRRGLPLRQRADRARRAGSGERVTIYLPMIPEAAIAMLACARIGAIHSVVFGGFSPEALAGRIQDCDSTAGHHCRCRDARRQGGPAESERRRRVLRSCPSVDAVLVVRHVGNDVALVDKGPRSLVARACARVFPPSASRWKWARKTRCSSSTPAGSTGKPKGVLHTSGGYLTWAAMTHHYVFDYRPGEIYWCAADIGWVTGHSYVVYGPLANRATVMMFEGVPNYPDHSRFWQIVDRHQVNIFYGAPTALRALDARGRRMGDEAPRAESLRLLGSASESRSILKPGSGTGAWWARGAARSSTPGGRPRPARR